MRRNLLTAFAMTVMTTVGLGALSVAPAVAAPSASASASASGLEHSAATAPVYGPVPRSSVASLMSPVSTDNVGRQFL